MSNSVEQSISLSNTRQAPSIGVVNALGSVRVLAEKDGSDTRISAEGALTIPLELEILTPLPEPFVSNYPKFGSSPIQIWEGEVIAIDTNTGDVDARLRSKMGDLPDHDVTVSREWIHDQDADLIKAGAVFYITLFKTLERGSIRNAQEIRFRRTPAWSEWQLARVNKAATGLLGKIVSAKPMENSNQVDAA